MDESAHGKYHENESEIVRTGIVFTGNGGLLAIDNGKHVVSELVSSDPTENPRDLLEIGICESDGTIPWREVGFDEVMDVSW